MFDDDDTMGISNILCFKCTHFSPVVDYNYSPVIDYNGDGVTDKWIREPCANSYYLCMICRDFKEKL